MTQAGALRVVMAQLDLSVGDVQGNAAQMIAAAGQARDAHGAGVVAFPELALLGYPPDDLLLRRGLPAAIDQGLARLCQEIDGITAVVGYPEFDGAAIYNAAAVVRDGRVIAGYRKQCLPNYGVFDERRHFSVGAQPCVFEQTGWRIAVSVCEDIWEPGPAAQARAAGGQLLINLNASPFHIGKQAEREARVGQCAAVNSLPVCYVNTVGGQDELVFDGASFAVDAAGAVVSRAPALEAGLYCTQWPHAGAGGTAQPPVQEQQVYDVLVRATRDYVVKNGFPGVLLGASGGIDSALVMAIAADALGGEHVHALAMPSRYTADISNDDAAEQAARLGVRYEQRPIEPVFASFLDTLEPIFGDLPADTTEENLQARIRGTLLMALSNKFGSLLLATGNKSELAVGYATLYGDMCGGFSPLKDVYKTWVYRLARYRNTRSAVIPQRVIDRPPSAELRANQRDSDSLPDYPTLDAIIEACVEAGESTEAICATGGYPADMVKRVTALIRRNEYKRRQAAPGPKVSRRAFGRERRYPITARWDHL